jgi:hypothetical protein
MNLLYYLHKDKLDSLGYDTIYLEQPVSDIVKDINWKQILSNPPNNTSKVTLKELELLASLTKNRTPKEIELVYNIDQDLDTPFELLCSSYGVEYPKTHIEEFYHIIRPILQNTKSYYNRPRPNQLAHYFDLKIDIIVTETHHTASYPSGHTVYSKLVSLILKDKYNQIDQTKLDNIVNQTKQARMLQGVHYPSDCDASLIFSTTLFNKLKGIFNE